MWPVIVRVDRHPGLRKAEIDDITVLIDDIIAARRKTGSASAPTSTALYRICCPYILGTGERHTGTRLLTALQIGSRLLILDDIAARNGRDRECVGSDTLRQ